MDYDVITPDQTILQQVLASTLNTPETKAQQLISAFSELALEGTLVWERNLIKSIESAVKLLDEKISNQLTAVMHHSQFKKLEGSWRGLSYLVDHTPSGESLSIKVLNVDKKTLSSDLEKASEFDQSHLFKMIYEQEYGTPGGKPYGLLVGDYTFSHHPQDVACLEKIAGIAAASFTPFITSPAPELFGINNWSQLSKPRDLASIFSSIEYTKWRELRSHEDSRFICLTMPRAMARLPYGQQTVPVNSFNYEEFTSTEPQPEQYTWMNAAYLLASNINNAMQDTGWPTRIRGAESGGKVDQLPCHIYQSANGDLKQQCPTEVAITDRREAQLSELGFLPLCHYKNTSQAVFFGSQCLQQAKVYDQSDATNNAKIATRLPYILATSRFAHYLKIMARDKIGSLMEANEVESWLNRWILNYVNGNPNSRQELKAKYPLAEAKVTVEAVEGEVGAYHAVAWLRPWLQFEELSASMRLVAKIPNRK